MSNTQFANKVIALTGGASGIGLATALLLASRGATLSLADLSQPGLDSAKDKILAQTPSAQVAVFSLDVRNYSQVESWISSTISQFGKLDGAENLAGVAPASISGEKGKIENLDEGEWEFIMGVNTTGVMHCMKAQLKSIESTGSIVNASSIAGITGRAMNGAYSASKHAVIGLTKSAAKEVGPKGIRVNCFCPGRINTPMLHMAAKAAAAAGNSAEAEAEMNNQVALRRKGEPEEVASLAVFLLSDEASYITGTAISVDGGWAC
ncbi:enoyl-(Acyl carrier protein) reductase domain-containing protein [Sarocladium implicatum]|nr:enoyl-(Acyl carrier protein) reductase domain-containing protein [Sarocladium implicatum]